MDKTTLLKAMLFFIGIYHLFLGLAAFISSNIAVQLMKLLFDMDFHLTPQMLYISKLLGIYFLAFGITMIITMLNPIRYRSFIILAIGVYAIRILSRILHDDLIQDAFGVSDTMMWIEIFLLSTFGGSLVLLLPSKNK